MTLANDQIAVSFLNEQRLSKKSLQSLQSPPSSSSLLLSDKVDSVQTEVFVLHNNCHNHYNLADDGDDLKSPKITNNKANSISKNSNSSSSISHSNDDLRHSTNKNKNKKKKKKKQFPTRSNDIHSSLTTAHTNNDSQQLKQQQQQPECEHFEQNQFERIFDQKVHSNNQTPLSSSSWYWLLTLANSKHRQHYLQPESTSCIDEQITTTTKIMNHGIEDCRHIRPLSPVEEHRMLLSNSNGLTLKTTPSQHQTIRCDNSNNLNNEINNQSSLSSTLPHRNHKKSKGIQPTTTTNKQQSLLKFNLQPGHSNTLPTNSTLSSLMAANGHNNMNQHYLNQQRQLRRQISLNNLDKMINSSSSMTTSNSNTNLTKENSFHVNGKQSSPASNSTPSTSKVSLFQQKIRAILSPSSINKDNNQTQTTLSKSGSTDIDHNDKRQNESTYRSYGNLASSTSIQYNVDKEDAVGRLEPKIKQEQKNCANNKNSESSSSFNDNDFNGNNNNNHNHNEASLLPSTMQQWQSSSSTMVNPNLNHYHQQQQQHIDSCLLNTLNKYTISASVSNNLNNLSASTSAKLLRPSSNELETNDDEELSYSYN
ncbi:hypothetical protein DERP_002192 [Dermatophagoides pteronyssinus]|uniref:Uncharacterized protein n=1 Tax=Dermatophagoides pteronyssinus TaxID=6956 RepID=A0ABQ8JHI8_DERPT|nr:hypothetical protein DERP_002192 [Dermatophagoides pteronyssinus]